MVGLGKQASGWLLRSGLVAGVLGIGSMAAGVELQADQAIAFRCRVGGGFGIAQPIQQTPTQQTQDGFNVAASGTAIQDTPAGEAIKLIKQEQWVKAIQMIESLDTSDDKLVLDELGVLRPLSAMKSSLIASMPDAGRRTFRKLNDPSANTKLAEAQAMTQLDQRAELLKSIVDSYALCDAAGSAARQLGEIRFEQGRFHEAAAYYQFAAEHPAAFADDASLMARRLAALARAEQWDAFDALAQYVRFRHPQTTLAIGGEETPIVSLIDRLTIPRDATPHTPTHPTPTRLVMPQQPSLDYDRPLIAEADLKLLRQFAINHNLASVIDQIIAPVVATDHDRVFTLSLGTVARLDPETGSELWRIGEPDQTIQKFTQRMHQLAGGFHQSLSIHGDTLLATFTGDGQDLNAYLFALDPESGQVRWSQKKERAHRSDYAMVGQPLVVDDLLYFVTVRDSIELTLRAVRLSDGVEVASLALGKASKGPTLSAPAELSPRLTMGQSHLMVQTNNGALIAVDPKNMTIAWAFTQKIRESGMNMMRRHGMTVANALAHHTGDVIASDGLIIAKDTRTNRIVAFREYDAAMLWSADSDADATIVHHDDEHVYVLGEELVALDRQTGKRIWWTPHPGDRSGRPVFTDDACLMAGNHRLCQIDLATGKLTHYREDFTNSADLHVVGNRLISVTDQRITAIVLP